MFNPFFFLVLLHELWHLAAYKIIDPDGSWRITREGYVYILEVDSTQELTSGEQGFIAMVFPSMIALYLGLAAMTLMAYGQILGSEILFASGVFLGVIALTGVPSRRDAETAGL